jgi:4-diphosphocytidyl-2-C-methyl-D-erythritol kinase
VDTFRAYAKINLGLHVLEKRPDGYHNIETVFHRVNLFDEISFSFSSTVTVVSSPSIVPGDERNICFKAAKLLQDHLRIETGVKISIQKNIPVGAGLGGGSSDAASVLLHLSQYWGKKSPKELLHSLALQLGSDVPYFLHRGSALAKGRGELLEYFPFDVPYTILLCNPGIHVSSGWAYQQVKTRHHSADLKKNVVEGMQNPTALSSLTNDFEPAVFRVHPAIGTIKETMLRSGAVVSLMSGSGSTVYGLFDDERRATDAATTLNAQHWRTFFTEPHFSPPDSRL